MPRRWIWPAREPCSRYDGGKPMARLYSSGVSIRIFVPCTIAQRSRVVTVPRGQSRERPVSPEPGQFRSELRNVELDLFVFEPGQRLAGDLHEHLGSVARFYDQRCGPAGERNYSCQPERTAGGGNSWVKKKAAVTWMSGTCAGRSGGRGYTLRATAAQRSSASTNPKKTRRHLGSGRDRVGSTIAHPLPALTLSNSYPNRSGLSIVKVEMLALGRTAACPSFGRLPSGCRGQRITIGNATHA